MPLPHFRRPQLHLGHDAVLVVLVLIATAAPVWFVSFPPATDLPQHLCQAFLLDEVLAGRHTELSITPWYFPNTLIYALIFAFWKMTDPITTGRLTYSALACFWVFGAYLLCRSRRRPIANWLIGIPLVFNFIFYWGLFNYLLGWPLFCLFVATVSAGETPGKPWLTLALALLLYYAHALWFLMANLWLLTHLMERNQPFRAKAVIPMIPSWLLALAWYPRLVAARTASGADTGVTWGPMPMQKLAPVYLTDSALGGLNGQLEQVFLLFLLGWILACLISSRKTLESDIDRPILLAAILFILAYWILPYSYLNTIFFNRRWLPCGLVLLLMALPSPKCSRSFAYTLGTAWLLLFATASISAWQEWEKEQLGGLREAIAGINKNERVFGLDMLGGSLHIKGRPGLQIFAYAQALRGADLNFSFVEHYSGIVQFKTQPPKNQSRKLIWMPLQVKREDLAGFDKVLLNGDAARHDYARRHLGLEEYAVTDKTWRLYRIRRD